MKRFTCLLGVITLSMLLFVTGVNASTVDESKAPDKVFIGWDPNVDVEVREDIFYVTLTGDINQDLIIENGEEVILDLNGFTFENFTKECEAIKVLKGGKLTIIDSGDTGTVTHIEGSTYSPITNLGTLIIEDGNYTISDSFYIVRNEGIATINGGTFTSTSTDTSMIGNIQYEDTSVTPVLTIEDGTFTAVSNVLKNNENSVMVVNGGTLTSENAYALDNAAVAEVNGGTLTSENNSPIRNIINPTDGNEASLKVSNATLNAAADKADYALYDATLQSDVTDKYEVSVDENGNITFVSTEIPDPVPENPDTTTPEEPIENPSTNDNVVTYIVLGAVSIIGIVAAGILIKRFN